ncbi:MAG: thioredoxin domain-containing protein [Gemmatales bacterium]|nr:thioredoxin domain-containing protein [Gemmatales bacterium]MDW8386161.1 thioredoxin domain-containing protein [Gemmatales bacterium]
MPQLNRLQYETSPYLRQHAANPVDWYPWGDEALRRAREEDKPIFLSIGYSACHWCHVMEHESFSDPEIAELMNRHFINIKVDREERPDLDQIYMDAVMAVTGQGGWPMSVWLTPDLKPFYVGTYFPPDDRYGRPGFKRVLKALADAWREHRDQLVHQAEAVTEHLREQAHLHDDGGELSVDLIRAALITLDRAFDPHYGGFGRAPKFPHVFELKLLLRAAKRFQDPQALEMVETTLDRMARGGIYDHLGGGFHRYSTDARWLVPHFEKMLYDNALLAQVYLEAYQGTGKEEYRRVVEETLAWVEREMTDPEGGFYSTLDADSEGEEGKFYVWTFDEVRAVLGNDDAELFAAVYDVTEPGNWEGRNILNRPKTLAQDARLLRMSETELADKLRPLRQKLLAARNGRVRPLRDDKIITAWNGLMIAAFARAGQVLDPHYAEVARRAARFVLDRLRGADGRLFRTISPGSPPKFSAYLEDYTCLIDALITLYETDFDLPWMRAALDLTDIVLRDFRDEAEGGFFFVGREHEPLIVRQKDLHDGSTPSGNSMAVTALLRLAKLTGRRDLEDEAVRTLRLARAQIEAAPLAFGQMLVALDFYLGPVDEVAVVGPASQPETREVLSLIRRGFRPNQVVAFLDTELPPAERERIAEVIPLLAGKSAVGGQVTVYVCRDFTCAEPLVGLEAVRRGRIPHSPQTSLNTSSET